MSRRALILAAGPLGAEDRLRRLLRPDDVIVCADGGAAHAAVLGVVPDIVIGDLDSVAPALVAALRANGHTRVIDDPDQRRTDLELAIDAAQTLGATEALVLGALGGRADHMLANLLLPAWLALRTPSAQHAPLPLLFTDGMQWIRHIDGRLVLHGQAGDIVSVVPLTPVPDLHFEGLHYPANEPPYTLGWQGVSNRMLGTEAVIDIGQGRALVIHIPSVWTA
jgi:thiamine pyrophosphokinase